MKEERDPEQAWFWTKEWQRGERQVDAEIRHGLGTTYYSTEEFLAALEDYDGSEEDDFYCLWCQGWPAYVRLWPFRIWPLAIAHQKYLAWKLRSDKE